MKYLITGATGEIGTAILKHLANEGKNLILAARNQEKLSNLKRELSCNGCEHVTLPIDFSNSESIKNCLCNVEELAGLVLNPPRIPSSNELFPGDEEWIRIFREVFLNPLSLIKHSIDKMDQSKINKVVIISGISSIQVMSNYSINSAIRACWLAEAKTLSMNFSHVCFNTLSLAGILTDAYKSKIKNKSISTGRTYDQLYADSISNVPLKKYATLEEVSQVVSSFLGAMSDHITGNNILIDGGYTKSIF